MDIENPEHWSKEERELFIKMYKQSRQKFSGIVGIPIIFETPGNMPKNLNFFNPLLDEKPKRKMKKKKKKK